MTHGKVNADPGVLPFLMAQGSTCTAQEHTFMVKNTPSWLKHTCMAQGTMTIPMATMTMRMIPLSPGGDDNANAVNNLDARAVETTMMLTAMMLMMMVMMVMAIMMMMAVVVASCNLHGQLIFVCSWHPQLIHHLTWNLGPRT